APHPGGGERRPDVPGDPFVGVVVANELLDNLPIRLCVFDGAWREALVVVGPHGTFAEGLSAPLAPLPAVLPATAPHGARAPLHDDAVAWVDVARAGVERGRIVA